MKFKQINEAKDPWKIKKVEAEVKKNKGEPLKRFELIFGDDKAKYYIDPKTKNIVSFDSYFNRKSWGVEAPIEYLDDAETMTWKQIQKEIANDYK